MIIVFVGPSLERPRVEAALTGAEASVRPPAAQGDVYHASRSRPDTIVLIDGYFHSVAAVWHKEILYALNRGIRVIGASSMGALRAAELEPFGMIGVGAVFEAFRGGHLVADDEVALLHGDATSGYRKMSEPLVNIRATLHKACVKGIIDTISCDQALSIARSLHYSERTYPNLIERLRDRAAAASLTAWLKTEKIDQKALDAEHALQLAVKRLDLPSEAREWAFEHTAMWDELCRQLPNRRDAHDFGNEEVLGRIEADPATFTSIATAALARLLASDVAWRHGRSVSGDDLVQALENLRRRLHLIDPDDLEQWMQESGFTVEGLIHLLSSEIHLDWAMAALARDLEPYLLDQMRISRTYTIRGRRCHPPRVEQLER